MKTSSTFKSAMLAGALGATLRGSAAAIAATFTLTAMPAFAEQSFQFNIPAQDLGSALDAFGAQTGLQVAASSDNTLNKQTAGVSGNLTAQEALGQLLAESGLSYRFVNSDTVIVEKNKLSSPVQNNESAGNSSKPTMIEEIIVTAEKREQNLQEVPTSITAYTSDALNARNISAPTELQFSVPGLVITESKSESPMALVFIRGIGTENVRAGFGDPGVPLHINGHYTQSTAYVMRDMLDVERVEVQRGPQGTLYGRNAIGGNINIITKRPTQDFEGSVGVTLGNYNKKQIQAVVNGPLGDSLSGRLVISDDSRDGFVENVGGVGEDRLNSDYTSVRAALEFNPTDNLQMYLNAYDFTDKGNRPVLQEDILGAANPTNLDPFSISTNTEDQNIDESQGVSLDISWNLGGVELRSLSAWDETTNDLTADGDGTAIYITEFTEAAKYTTYTQEFQMLSAGDGPAKWVVGLFYYNEETEQSRHGTYDPVGSVLSSPQLGLLLWDTNGDTLVNANDPLLLQNIVRSPSAESIAAYGQLNYSLNEKYELIAGLRYTKDTKTAEELRYYTLSDGTLLPPQNLLFAAQTPAPSFYDDGSWDEVTGKLGLNYYASEDVMLYASWSQGYKAGGYIGNPASNPEPYDPEYVDAFEVGLKSEWMDNRVQLNMAAFYYDYSDKQDSQQTGLLSGAIRNASAATITGLEIEAQALIMDNLLVDTSIGYLNAEFDDYETIDGARPSLGLLDLSGNELRYSPRWKVHVGAEYQWSLGSSLGMLSLRGDYSWTDDQWANALNRDASSGLFGNGDLLSSYHLINARLKWESDNGNWLAELYAKNLTDELIQTYVTTGSAASALVGYYQPRTYGLKVTYQF